MPSKLKASMLPVLAGESPWTAQEIRALSSQLREGVKELEGELESANAELSELLRNSGDGAGDDQADYGSSALEREQELTLVNNIRDLLRQHLAALDRIEEGTFGVCEACGQAIGKARLQAFPRVALCMKCKQREERR